MANQILTKLDCSLVIVTLGAFGIVVAFKQDVIQDVMVLEFEAMTGIHPVDSTGAGDCFIGYFIGSLIEYGGLPRVWSEETLLGVLVPSIKMGIVASGLSTLKKGTIVSYPDKNTVLDSLFRMN
jgi:sugar/nucleoside kinase (ribokinase family)